MLISWILSLSLLPSWAASPYGIVLMAHGGAPGWNEEVGKIAAELSAAAPTEVAIGMADAESLQKALDGLEARGVEKVVAVPLFINSASEVMDQTRYVLGLSEKPSAVFRDGMLRMAQAMGSHAAHMGMKMPTAPAAFTVRVKTGLPVVMTAALDDSPLIGAVLLERAKALSKDASRETVILVGHGPVDETANKAWLETMSVLAQRVGKPGRFKAARAATLRDDNAPEVKAKAAASLRKLVSDAGKGGGRAIVIPYLIARGGVEDHITETLKGLTYAWDGQTLCPHPNLAAWADAVARDGAKKDNMRRFH